MKLFYLTSGQDPGKDLEGVFNDIEIIKAYSGIGEYKPFNVFATAFEKYLSEPLFRPKDHVSFSKVFAIDRSGLLLAESSVKMEGDMDADIFAGMLSAVQDFVRNSISENKILFSINVFR